MNDGEIVEMFLQRQEKAIEMLSMKYQAYCGKIAWNLLKNQEDTEECLNDTWYAVWSHIPPQKPANLSVYVGRITRNLAIDKLRKKMALKRADAHQAEMLREMDELNVSYTLDEQVAYQELQRALHTFLKNLPEADRNIFIRRYWFMDEIREIAKRHGVTAGSIKMNLYRNRKKLWKKLREEGESE